MNQIFNLKINFNKNNKVYYINNLIKLIYSNNTKFCKMLLNNRLNNQNQLKK